MMSYGRATPDYWLLANQVILPTSKQQRRLIRYLLNHQGATTIEVNRGCAIGNISDVACKANAMLHRVGLYICCENPPTPIPNRFAESSQMFLWSIVVMPNAEHLIEPFSQVSAYKKAVPD
jgi:hypothetical protein